MSQYATLGSALLPSRVPHYTSSIAVPAVPNPAPRFGPSGTKTRYCPTYNGAYSRYSLQIDEPVVPHTELNFPRHSKKTSVSYSGWMLKHTGISNQWARRWFVLEGGLLSYFYDRADKVAKSVIPMSSYSVHHGDDELQRRHCLVLKPIFPGDVEYRLCCESPFSQRTWMAKLGAGSHKGRIKFICIGDEACGKTKLLDSVFYNSSQDCELKASNPSVGSHLGYIPASKTHRRDLLIGTPLGEQVVAVECTESPGRGDFSHIRELLYNGVDCVLAVFSLADKPSMLWLEQMMSNEVSSRVDAAPIIVVGMKADLRDARIPVPAVGHAVPGSRGHLSPMNRHEFHLVSRAEGEEFAARLGAVHYFESDGFDSSDHAEILQTVTLAGLEFRRP